MARLARPLLLTAFVAIVALTARAQSPPAPVPAIDVTAFVGSMRWRSLGPETSGETIAVAGSASAAATVHTGLADGGLWRTQDSGVTWQAVDTLPLSNISAVGVAASNPSILYVGSGSADVPHASPGAGLFKSVDAGATWTGIGLTGTERISAVVVDERSPDRLLVAALGPLYRASADRGVFRSVDGGRTFEKVLFRDDNTGADDIAVTGAGAEATVFVSLREMRRKPWADAAWYGPGTRLVRSLDGGTNWSDISGLPSASADGVTRIRVAVGGTDGRRVAALLTSPSRGGLYLSNDRGDTWTPSDARGLAAALAVSLDDFADVEIDPRNPDVIYVIGTSIWRSIDGGRTFTAWRPEVPGHRYRRLWLDRSTAGRAVVSSSRGTSITTNDGQTWSVPQPIATQGFATTATDSAFPYRVCGGALTSGGECVPVGRQLTATVDRPGLLPSGTVVPDPSDADVLFSGSVSRFDRRTAQTQDVSPPADPSLRRSARAPLAFAPTDSRSLFFGANRLWKTSNAGQAWVPISPDLSRETWEIPQTVGVFTSAAGEEVERAGAISSLGPSPVDGRIIWAGTNDGLVHVTRDGGTTWRDVTPASVAAWAAVTSVEPSRFDTNTAYLTVDSTRLGTAAPLAFRTRSSGASWSPIGASFGAGVVAYAIREDPFRRGLLFAATSAGVFVSFDDGDRWHVMQLNLPRTPVRDLVVKEGDLIAATAGRGFWVLDDITPLRQITNDVARADAFLFRPVVAWRTGRDPVQLNYYLGTTAKTPITLEIIATASGEVIRRFSSDASDPDRARDTSPLATTAGLHRLEWDLRYASPTGDAARPGILVLPGTYQVRLTVGAMSFRQGVIVRLDPRTRTSLTDLTAQFTLARTVGTMLRRLEEDATRTPGSPERPAVEQTRRALSVLLMRLQQSDTRPTAALDAAAAAALAQAEQLLATSGR